MLCSHAQGSLAVFTLPTVSKPRAVCIGGFNTVSRYMEGISLSSNVFAYMLNAYIQADLPHTVEREKQLQTARLSL